MAPTVRKFRVPSGRMLAISCAVFILLSDVLATSEQRQCFWCGPLAEQIHRSRRAPACDVPGENVTTCDPGLTHCAMVATSPPYVESRYCVKFYQDECYSLYCNSTKTWRMTCPCRGDFCNGEKTERESEAFARLAKLATKNNRIKKRTIVTSSSIVTADKNQAAGALAEENIANEVDNITYNENIYNISQTDEHNITNIANENMSTKSDNILESTDIDTNNNKSNDHELNIIEHDTDKRITSKESREQLISVRTPPIQSMESSVTIIEVSTEKTIISNSVEPNEQTVIEIEQEIVDSDGKLINAELKTEKPTEIMSHEKSIDNNLIKPSEVMPTAEALQQNGSPPTTMAISEKPEIIPEQATAITTHVDSTEKTTLKHDETAETEPTKGKGNGGEKNIVQTYVICNCIFLYLVI